MGFVYIIINFIVDIQVVNTCYSLVQLNTYAISVYQHFCADARWHPTIGRRKTDLLQIVYIYGTEFGHHFVSIFKFGSRMSIWSVLKMMMQDDSTWINWFTFYKWFLLDLGFFYSSVIDKA